VGDARFAENAPEVLDERMNSRGVDTQARSTTDTVARRSYGKLVAFQGM
jgi:hypothetical protein